LGPIYAKKVFWKSDWFLMVDFLYLIPPSEEEVTNQMFGKGKGSKSNQGKRKKKMRIFSCSSVV
jgi:hypothetical protein